MNIKEAKTEIKNTVKAYTRKDASGRYFMPAMRQRPVLLIGPPGIGKTAIMEQIAKECGIGLVSYTITHHTRQSAIGLPVVVKRSYQGREYSVTEYTMSEIIASVYECMEKSGCREGILFIDEINCVSETLAPTMLQFLQCKTFGSHAVPKGWVIVAAGNPPEYNKSVREFDIVTLDRVKKIEVEADLDVWKEYAYEHCLHPGILSYLNLHRERFYHVENTKAETYFVTARGWEDLSEILYSYEEMGVECGESLILQYLQEPDTARDFAGYYQLYQKYGQDYKIPQMLDGTVDEQEYLEKVELAKNAPWDERLTVANLIMSGWNGYFSEYVQRERYMERLHGELKQIKESLRAGEDFEAYIRRKKHALEIKEKEELLDIAEEQLEREVLRTLECYLMEAKRRRCCEVCETAELLRELFDRELQSRKDIAERTELALTRGFAFAEDGLGTGPEMTLLVTDLTQNQAAMKFIQTFGCDKYFKYCDALMFEQRKKELLKKIDALEPGGISLW